MQIIFTNVGNPHALGQKPLTFPRQVVALCQAPFLLDNPNVGMIFPADAIARAKHYLSLTSGGLGMSLLSIYLLTIAKACKSKKHFCFNLLLCWMDCNLSCSVMCTRCPMLINEMYIDSNNDCISVSV